MIKQFFSRQFILFLITGGAAAGVNFFSCMLYERWFSFSTAVIIAYATGMVVAFVLFKLFVFEGSMRSLHYSAFLFFVVNMIGMAQTWGVSLLLAYYLLPAMGIVKFATTLGHAVGVATPVFTSFIFHKRWSFRR